MGNFKTILALDTALNHCGAAVYRDGKSCSESAAMMQGHAEHLLPMAERVLAAAGIAYGDIDALAVTTGPGAFTGLRIGLSAARAMALALDIPLYGITTTRLLALQAVRADPKPVAVILDTKREDFYFQSFDVRGEPLSEASVLPAAAIKTDGFILAGDGVTRLTGRTPVLEIPDVALMAELLAVRPEIFIPGAPAVYLRGADVTSSRRENRVFEGAQGLK